MLGPYAGGTTAKNRLSSRYSWVRTTRIDAIGEVRLRNLSGEDVSVLWRV
jgi:hypothetical protein